MSTREHTYALCSYSLNMKKIKLQLYMELKTYAVVLFLLFVCLFVCSNALVHTMALYTIPPLFHDFFFSFKKQMRKKISIFSRLHLKENFRITTKTKFKMTQNEMFLTQIYRLFSPSFSFDFILKQWTVAQQLQHKHYAQNYVNKLVQTHQAVPECQQYEEKTNLENGCK